jgi:hypothetical protein
MMASGEIRLTSMTMRQMPVLAQSQNPQGPAGSAAQDGVVLTPVGINGNSATMIVNLAPGSNTIQFTVTNIDPVTTGFPIIDNMQSEIALSTTLTTSGASGNITTTQTFNGAGGNALLLAPGQTYIQSNPGFMGPGTATMTFVNQSYTLLGVTLGVIYQQTPGH